MVRSWPLPPGKAPVRMVWHDLLFAHWPVKAEKLRPFVPKELELETYDGNAWIGIVPFRMSGVSHTALPNIPWLSAFPELNVRTYVNFQDKPGVWFFSLDASRLLAVWGAQLFFHLPYRWAKMSCKTNNSVVHYKTHRVKDKSIGFVGNYGPTGEVFAAAPNTFEYWLTERYCLYSQSASGKLYRGEIDHVPWPLQTAQAQIELNTMTKLLDLELKGEPTSLLWSSRLDVTSWWLKRCQVTTSNSQKKLLQAKPIRP